MGVYSGIIQSKERFEFLVINQLDAPISQICFEMKSTCFGQFLCPSSGVFHCTHSSGIGHTGFLTACKEDQDGTAVPS